MATELSTEPDSVRMDFIEVVTLDSRKCKIFVKDFSATTIKKIKSILEWEFDCEEEHIRLMCNGIKLHDDSKCLSDYKILNMDKLQMVQSIPGGNMSLLFNKIMFTDLTRVRGEGQSVEGMTIRPMSNTGPRYHVVTAGLNFLGFCKETSCNSQRNIVVIKIGIPKDPICFSYTLEQLKCPVCNAYIPKGNCIGMGLHLCRAKIEFKTNEKQDEYDLIAKDEFKQFVSTKEEERIAYIYLRITLKPLNLIA